MKLARKNMRKYFRNYGVTLSFAAYYVLSFFPYKFFSILRKRF